MALGGGMACVKYLMFLFNLLFAVTGLIIIIVATKAMVDSSQYIDFTNERFYTSGPVVLIIIGIIIFVVSFFGCFGAIKENRCMILTFATLLLIIFVAELAVGITGYVKHKDLEASVMTNLNETMFDTNDPNAIKNFNILQTDLKCCGINGPDDWAQHKKPIPGGCCATPVKQPDNSTTCKPDDETLHKTGCLTALLDLFKHIAAYLGGVGIGIAIIQVLGVIFACCLQRAIGSEYETV